MSKHYTPSGKFSPLSIVFLLLASVTIIPILGIVYSYLIYYIPFPYINFFITAGFGFGMGIILTQIIKFGKVRSVLISVILGLLGALIALYFAWAVWVNLAMGSENMMTDTLSLISDPGDLLSRLKIIKLLGVWGIGESAVKGTPLLIIWIIEAVIVVFLSVISPMASSREPFCEVNEKWFAAKRLPAFNFIENPHECATALQNMDVEYFRTLVRHPFPSQDSNSEFTLYSNETNENFLSITNKVASKNNKDEIEFKDNEITRHIEISEELSNILESM